MAKTKPRKYETVSGGGSISERASEWIRLFIKHVELNLLDTSRSLPPDASDLDYRVMRQTTNRWMIRQLDLNSPRLKRWRSMWMRIVALAAERNANLYGQLVGFPMTFPISPR